VNLLVGQAEAGVTPQNLADMVLNMTPDSKVAELKAFISRASVIDEMAACNPVVNSKHRQFFEALRNEILQALAEEEAATLDGSAAGSSGDAG
jgi:activator of HSP90 ATPase